MHGKASRGIDEMRDVRHSSVDLSDHHPYSSARQCTSFEAAPPPQHAIVLSTHPSIPTNGNFRSQAQLIASDSSPIKRVNWLPFIPHAERLCVTTAVGPNRIGQMQPTDPPSTPTSVSPLSSDQQQARPPGRRSRARRKMSENGSRKRGTGAWSEIEDERLSQLVNVIGTKNWAAIEAAMPERDKKQCRERWCNHVDPAIDDRAFTEHESIFIIQQFIQYGRQWARMSRCPELRGRPDNAIKNHFNTNLRDHYASLCKTLNVPHRLQNDQTEFDDALFARIKDRITAPPVSPARSSKPSRFVNASDSGAQDGRDDTSALTQQTSAIADPEGSYREMNQLADNSPSSKRIASMPSGNPSASHVNVHSLRTRHVSDTTAATAAFAALSQASAAEKLNNVVSERFASAHMVPSQPDLSTAADNHYGMRQPYHIANMPSMKASARRVTAPALATPDQLGSRSHNSIFASRHGSANMISHVNESAPGRDVRTPPFTSQIVNASVQRLVPPPLSSECSEPWRPVHPSSRSLQPKNSSTKMLPPTVARQERPQLPPPPLLPTTDDHRKRSNSQLDTEHKAQLEFCDGEVKRRRIDSMKSSNKVTQHASVEQLATTNLSIHDEDPVAYDSNGTVSAPTLDLIQHRKGSVSSHVSTITDRSILTPTTSTPWYSVHDPHIGSKQSNYGVKPRTAPNMESISCFAAADANTTKARPHTQAGDTRALGIPPPISQQRDRRMTTSALPSFDSLLRVVDMKSDFQRQERQREVLHWEEMCLHADEAKCREQLQQKLQQLDQREQQELEQMKQQQEQETQLMMHNLSERKRQYPLQLQQLHTTHFQRRQQLLNQQLPPMPPSSIGPFAFDAGAPSSPLRQCTVECPRT